MKKLAYVSLILGLMGCQGEPFTLAFLGSFTGNDSSLGVYGREGAMLAVEDLNAQGGIRGRLLRLESFDDKSMAGEATIQVQKIQELNIPLLIGPMTTGRAIEILPLVNQNKILTLGPTVAGIQVSYADDYFFRLYPSTLDFGRRLGQRVLTAGHQRPVALMDLANTGYSEPVIAGVKEVLDPRGLNVVSVGFKSNQNPNFRLIAEEVLSHKPDVVVCTIPAQVLALAVQNLKKLDPQIHILTPPYGMDTGLLVNGGQAVEGVIGEIPYDSEDPQDTFQKFQTRYKERFGRPPTHSAMACWEAVMIAAEGMKNTGDWSSMGIKASLLKSRQYQGLQARIEIDANGDAQRSLNLFVVEKGRFVPLKE